MADPASRPAMTAPATPAPATPAPATSDVSSAICPECATPLGNEGWATGLCLRCLAGFAEEDLAAQEDLSLLGSRIRNIRVLEKLGAGGLGSVYLGFDEILNREVALKALRDGGRLDADVRRRFLREARILSQLEHPNVCRIYDLLEEDDDVYLVLELLRGKTLRQALRDGIDPALRIDVARQVAEALVATHGQGVVHRDLKPENVMLVDDPATGRPLVKVLDFGLAQAREALEDDGAPTGASTYVYANTLPGDVVMGTVTYMSPEQALAEPLTRASDLYSFGLLLQELFTGHGAYEDGLEFPTLLRKVAQGETLGVVGLDRDLTALIERLKSLAPKARGSAAEAAARLRWIAEKPRRRLRRLSAAAAVVAVLLTGGKLTFDLHAEQQQALRERDEAVAASRVYRSRLAEDERLLGELYEAQGDLASALAALEASRELYARLLAEEAARTDDRDALADVERRLRRVREALADEREKSP